MLVDSWFFFVECFFLEIMHPITERLHTVVYVVRDVTPTESKRGCVEVFYTEWEKNVLCTFRCFHARRSGQQTIRHIIAVGRGQRYPPEKSERFQCVLDDDSAHPHPPSSICA